MHDRLFETLDPTTRAFEHEGRRYLVTDTVGFIRRLPHDLVEGFAATLEETLSAELVLHVLDASAPDEELDRMIAAVEEVLAEIGAAELPVELVLNKIDAVDPLGAGGSATGSRTPSRSPPSPVRAFRSCAPASRSASRSGSSSSACSSRMPTARSSRSSTRWGRRSTSARTPEEGVFIRARLPRRELARFAPYLIAIGTDSSASASPESHRASR